MQPLLMASIDGHSLNQVNDEKGSLVCAATTWLGVWGLFILQPLIGFVISKEDPREFAPKDGSKCINKE